MNLQKIALSIGITFFIVLVSIVSMLLESIFSNGNGLLSSWYSLLLGFIMILIIETFATLRKAGVKMRGEAEEFIKDIPTQKEENPLDKEFNNLKNEIKNGRRPKS